MKILKNISLKPFNTFGIDVLARTVLEVYNTEELKEALAYEQGKIAAQPFIIGGGSNILLMNNIARPVIRMSISGIEEVNETEEHVFLKVGAGVNWHEFVMHCINKNLAGVENLALIPGSVGASPMQNIGAYGVEVRDVLHELSAVQVMDGEEVIFSREDCKLGYRESVFKNVLKDQFVITDVTYRLNKYPVFNTSYGAIRNELERMDEGTLTVESIARAVMNIRRSKLPDPAVIGNAGSFFKNPQVTSEKYEALLKDFPALAAYDLNNGLFKLAAGWLIEQCGWKGKREGDAGCHEKQALVLVNYGSATGKEVLALCEKIRESVFEKFGVELEKEVNVVER
ncbi:MAG: UDP-N-acetylmuramate dehydrogenase [Chitinophagaceae bacterium]|nr:MAG: UDP-N-acetylmuramate dehydrogenase [Chitinophagaceae bacterium]